jgi:hypothetical protein
MNAEGEESLLTVSRTYVVLYVHSTYVLCSGGEVTLQGANASITSIIGLRALARLVWKNVV